MQFVNTVQMWCIICIVFTLTNVGNSSRMLMKKSPCVNNGDALSPGCFKNYPHHVRKDLLKNSAENSFLSVAHRFSDDNNIFIDPAASYSQEELERAQKRITQIKLNAAINELQLGLISLKPRYPYLAQLLQDFVSINGEIIEDFVRLEKPTKKEGDMLLNNLLELNRKFIVTKLIEILSPPENKQDSEYVPTGPVPEKR